MNAGTCIRCGSERRRPVDGGGLCVDCIVVAAIKLLKANVGELPGALMFPHVRQRLVPRLRAVLTDVHHSEICWERIAQVWAVDQYTGKLF